MAVHSIRFATVFGRYCTLIALKHLCTKIIFRLYIYIVSYSIHCDFLNKNFFRFLTIKTHTLLVQRAGQNQTKSKYRTTYIVKQHINNQADENFGIKIMKAKNVQNQLNGIQNRTKTYTAYSNLQALKFLTHFQDPMSLSQNSFDVLPRKKGKRNHDKNEPVIYRLRSGRSAQCAIALVLK